MTIKRVIGTEWLILSLLLVLAILIRSLNFSESFNFSSDQGKFSIKALEILRGENENFGLIGPSISFQLDGREIFQGGVVYYFLALILFLGGQDPLNSSYVFMILSCFMVVPLYFGVKFLTNKNKAFFIAILFCFLPIFVNHTKFLWNPNFQLSLLPFIFLFLGLYKKYKNSWWLLVAGIWFGIIFQFHYQLFIGGLVLLAYLKIFLKTSWLKILVFIIGFIIGLSPIIIFELRNNFYNLNTLILYLQNFSEFQKSNPTSGNFFTTQHYFLSLLIIIAVVTISAPIKITNKILFAIAGILIIYDLFIFYPQPTQAFGMKENWNYPSEKKAFEIIESQKRPSYSVTNLGYDTLAYVQKYLHKKDKLELAEYWEMEELFIIAPKQKDIFNDPAYEVRVISPISVIQTWEINPHYNLYLVKRVP